MEVIFREESTSVMLTFVFASEQETNVFARLMEDSLDKGSITIDFHDGGKIADRLS